MHGLTRICGRLQVILPLYADGIETHTHTHTQPHVETKTYSMALNIYIPA